MVNTEQPQTKAALKNQGAVAKVKGTKAPKGVPPNAEGGKAKPDIKVEKKIEVAKEKVEETKTEVKPETKVEDKPKTDVKVEGNVKTSQSATQEGSKKKQPVKKVKKEEISINAQSVHVSAKYAISICKFIKRKRIGDAIRDLEAVAVLKKAVPMKGEIPHRKGKIMSGRFPQRAAKEFIVLLKSLAGNANNHEIDDPVITVAIANRAAQPFGRFGRWKRKRTHITIKAREKKVKLKENKEKKK